jgi:hypothetical protein
LKLKKLTTIEEIESLVKDEILIIKWDKRARNNRNKPIGPLMATKVRENKAYAEEIILDEPNNVYFCYTRIRGI